MQYWFIEEVLKEHLVETFGCTVVSEDVYPNLGTHYVLETYHPEGFPGVMIEITPSFTSAEIEFSTWCNGGQKRTHKLATYYSNLFKVAEQYVDEELAAIPLPGRIASIILNATDALFEVYNGHKVFYYNTFCNTYYLTDKLNDCKPHNLISEDESRVHAEFYAEGYTEIYATIRLKWNCNGLVITVNTESRESILSTSSITVPIAFETVVTAANTSVVEKDSLEVALFTMVRRHIKDATKRAEENEQKRRKFERIVARCGYDK